MSTRITLTLPDNVYRQAEYVAQTTNRPVTEVLAETLALAFPPLHVSPARPAMQREATAFEAMRGNLWKQYPRQYVAIYQGSLIDHDVDEAALVERIEQHYPEAVVLIRQVLPHPPQPLRFRSPRLARP